MSRRAEEQTCLDYEYLVQRVRSLVKSINLINQVQVQFLKVK
jgi:hypothetical protein